MSGKILIIDDQPENRSMLYAALREHHFELVDSRSEEALLRFRTELPNLVLISQNPLGEDAFAICRALRSVSAAPIVFVSTAASAERVVAALDAGADDYLAPPFQPEELLARIRAVLRRSVAKADALPAQLSLDGVEINFATRQITAQDRAAHLTPKEFELLKFLVAHAGKVVSHRTILQAIWGPDYDGQVDYLRVFINQLRKKIETDPSNPKFILTEPWVGYRFVLPDALFNARAS